MEKCLQCNKALQHVPGRKQKSFCDVNCRNKYFYAQKKKQIEDAKAILASLPPDYPVPNKVAVLAKDGGIKQILPKPGKEPKTEPISNFEKAISDTAKEAILKQIAAIRAEKVPKDRDTVFGRKSWALDQKKRIEELEKQIR